MASRKLVQIHKMYIKAGKASPSPPLGPALGQVLIVLKIENVNIKSKYLD